MVTELFFKEFHSKNAGVFLRVNEYLTRVKSKFQLIEVFRNDDFGKVLLLDGLVMLSERDEHFYHEMLVHPGLSLLDDKMRVLVIGGGDGGTVREILKHNPTEVVLVEIDEHVINVSREHFRSLACAFDDPRVKIVIDDGVEFVRARKDSGFDAVIIDSTDPVGPAKALFSLEFYFNLKEIMNKNSILVTQSESPLYDKNFIVELIRNLKNLFRNVEHYIGPMPLYPAGIWSYTFASDSYSLSSKKKREIKDTKFYLPEMIPTTTKEIQNEISGII